MVCVVLCVWGRVHVIGLPVWSLPQQDTTQSLKLLLYNYQYIHGLENCYTVTVYTTHTMPTRHQFVKL